MKIILAQHGARHRYLIAQILEQAGFLAALYTDSSAESLIGNLATKLPFQSGSLSRLANRKIEGVPSNKIYSSDITLYSGLIGKLISNQNNLKRGIRQHDVFSKKMQKWGCLNADAVYAMQDESHDFLCYAKRKGLKIIIDTCVTPLALRKTKQQQILNPGWEAEISDEELTFFEDEFKKNLLIADIILCPSKVVESDLKQFIPLLEAQIKVIPYGSSVSSGVNDPIRGRILFVGAGCIRKGIHTLAKAANKCVHNGVKFDFRVVGDVSDQIKKKNEASNLNFIGKLPKEELLEEYRLADVIVFPTLAEGLPGVILEALAYGLPIITTKSCGIEIEDGKSGFHIPEGDSSILCKKLCVLVDDRTLRDAVSRQAKKLSKLYSNESYKVRLIEALSW
ncbi:MAG: glycosyltransferase involved in cell wall biosynthesis [Oceanospirillaceae bacterium]|jgi:glycosyltransferase involved in cell wall biosynthesis